MQIKEIKEPCDKVHLTAICDKVVQGVASNQQAYLTIVLKDSTGIIEMRLWGASLEDINAWKKGQIYEITASVIEYKKSLQLKSLSYQVMSMNQLDLNQFVESAPINAEAVYNEIYDVMQNLSNDNYKKLMLEILNVFGEKFKIWPAAIRNHHEIKHGLMWHSYTMMKTAQALSGIYADRLIDFDLLYAGVILHDLGKVVEINAGLSSDFTLQGKLIGHISIMSAKIFELGEKLHLNMDDITMLQHMVLASHGRLEYGSPVEPHLMEAEILSFLDNMDARIYRINRELHNVKEGESTPMIMSLEKRWFIRHK